MNIRSLTPEDIPWVEAVVSDHFGSPRVVSRGVLHDACSLPGLVAEEAAERTGLLQYRIDGEQCEVIILIALKPRQGIGRALLRTAEELAKAASCCRMWLVTTDNNLGAQAFYRTAGWTQAAVHRDAVAAARKLKPEIPRVDERGRSIRDEIEFELLLRSG
ncbi:MAG: GNAT family N-acetyltransferase [Anaerolineales bacterium]|nr:GNAT family N-acetyltransferase [Anaerolineales bacterium]